MKLAAGSDRHSIAKCGSEDGQPPPPLPSPPLDTWCPLLIDYSLRVGGNANAYSKSKKLKDYT